MNKLTEKQRDEIKQKYESGKGTHRTLAEEYGVSHSTISRICNFLYAERERKLNRERIKANRKNYKLKNYHLSFHLENDSDVIAKLDSLDNKQGYIRKLVRNDISENN